MILDKFFFDFPDNYSRRVCKSTNKKFWPYFVTGEPIVNHYHSIGAGSTFGELALIRDMMRDYTAVCTGTVMPVKSDSDVMFCLQSYQGLIIDISFVS